jgi:hypothetical protein
VDQHATVKSGTPLPGLDGGAGTTVTPVATTVTPVATTVTPVAVPPAAPLHAQASHRNTRPSSSSYSSSSSSSGTAGSPSLTPSVANAEGRHAGMSSCGKRADKRRAAAPVAGAQRPGARRRVRQGGADDLACAGVDEVAVGEVAGVATVVFKAQRCLLSEPPPGVCHT